MDGSTGQLLLGFYGDDFSGSTAALEVLALAGVRTVLLLRGPGTDWRDRLPDVQAVGLAGVSRSLSPAAMEAELKPAFAALADLNAGMIHYKVCSTFDSSPEVGSIGRAIELGQAALGAAFVPVPAGDPALGRYGVFGHLFARSGPYGPVWRLDRHPTMSCHPVTPMAESDLARHLARQTSRPIALLDVLTLSGRDGPPEEHLARLRSAGAEVVLLDLLDESQLATVGRLLWEHGGRFVVGSSAVEDALTAWWQESGLLPEPPPRPVLQPVDRVLVVSGSCSPVTAGQIGHALEQGFAEVALAPAHWADPHGPETGPAFEKMLALLTTGRSVVIHAARGPNDPRIGAVRTLLSAAGEGHRDQALGRVLAPLVRAAAAAGVRRVAVAGGDTAGYVARQLGLEALSFVAPLAPGVPLCRAHAGPDAPNLDGLEIAFKGGQVGQVDFFQRLLRGNELFPARS